MDENVLLILGRYFVVLEAMLTPLGHATLSIHIKGAVGRQRSSIQHYVVTYVATEAGRHFEQGCKNINDPHS